MSKNKLQQKSTTELSKDFRSTVIRLENDLKNRFTGFEINIKVSPMHH